MFKLTTLNLNGIRSACGKGLESWAQQLEADCICVQEMRISESADQERFSRLAGLAGYFHLAEKKGYSGVGLYSRLTPTDVLMGMGSAQSAPFDAEGRYVEARFDRADQRFSVISCYVPSGSSGEERQRVKYAFLDVLAEHLQRLQGSRQFIVCGDINIAHRAIDLKNWRSNQKNSGFLPQERAWLDRMLRPGALVDVYRQLHPEAGEDCYTWWSNRGRAWDNNVGWRLDYQLATPAAAQGAIRSSIYKEQRFSDHAPLTIEYQWGN